MLKHISIYTADEIPKHNQSQHIQQINIKKSTYKIRIYLTV